jgi:ABC-2 type transport system ATP-binding protein
MAQDTDVAIEFRGVSYRLDTGPYLLEDFNLQVRRGQTLVLLGRSGAGKTTALKIFTDLIRPSSGQALINGQNVHTHKKAALSSVGSLIEMPEIYPSLTPREALRMVAEIRGVAGGLRNDAIDEAMEEVKMTDWADQRVGKFSKGMKQRIAVASTLLHDPQVLLLDEPSTGLDPRGMSEVRDIVKRLKSKNRLVFMSSHLLAEVSEVCDEVAMIDHGKLLVYDSISNVTSKFANGNGSVEVGLARPIDDPRLAEVGRLSNVVSVERPNPTTLKLKFSGGLQAQQQILADLVRLDVGVVSFSKSASALEEVYLSLIKETL